jgi:hypothetical protein
MKSFILGFLVAIVVVLIFTRVVSLYEAPQFPNTLEEITKMYKSEIERLSREMESQAQAKPEDREKFVQDLANSMDILNNAYNTAIMSVSLQDSTTTVNSN